MSGLLRGESGPVTVREVERCVGLYEMISIELKSLLSNFFENCDKSTE